MPESVLVIGCGPGGMFFCHAMEAKRRELAGNPEALAALPTVTVFERASSPGGVWRSERNRDPVSTGEEKKESDLVTEPNRSTQMYEALWTNGPKEGIEFFDYSYDEHFGRQLPVYMPRQPILEYMIARVVKNCPDFFDKYVQFNTSVSKVVYDEKEKKFNVTTHNALTGQILTHKYDKCIWAAGDQGLPLMPQALLRKLDGFCGRIIHSTDTSNFANDVRGKRVLIVGGRYSAEDLALVACKVGVEKAYITTRVNDSAVTWTKEWPDNKVEVLTSRTPVSIENGSTVVLEPLKWVKDTTYVTDEEEDPLRLENIDTIILCTGYRKQFDMLEPKLKSWIDDQETSTFPVPADWKMDDNAFTSSMKDVPTPTEARYYGTMVHWSQLYRGVLIANPNMMFLRSDHEDYPILVMDANARLFMQFITGGREVPSPEEMRRQNEEQALNEMKTFIHSRYYMDKAYFDMYNERQSKIDPESTHIYASEAKFLKYDFNVLARTMDEGKHPAAIGTYEKLNQRGEALYNYGCLGYYHRTNATTKTTFRDVTDAHKFKSLVTGTEAIPFQKLWMDIDENSQEENLV